MFGGLPVTAEARANAATMLDRIRTWQKERSAISHQPSAISRQPSAVSRPVVVVGGLSSIGRGLADRLA